MSFSNGQLKPSSSSQPRFSLYHKGGTANKKRKILVSKINSHKIIATSYYLRIAIYGGISLFNDKLQYW